MTLNSNVSITWLGHSTLILESPAGNRIIIDPFILSNPSCPDAWKNEGNLGKLEAMLITHIHEDHIGDVEMVIRSNPLIQVVGMPEVITRVSPYGASNVQPMNKGGTINILDLMITMTDANHSSSYPNADNENMLDYGGEPAGFILKFNNGFTIYVAGDTGIFGDMALIGKLYHPDLAILPIGDRFTMGPFQAAHAVQLLGVSQVLPYHYGTFGLLTGTPEAFRKEMATLGLENVVLHSLQPGDTLN